MPIDGPDAAAAGRLTIHASLAAAEARWRAAWPRTAGYAFQSYDWVAAWQEALGDRAGWRPCIVELRAHDDDRTLLLLPLGIRREGLLRVLGFLGGGLIDYQAPLVDAAFAATVTPERMRRLWTTILATLPAVDMVQLRRMPACIGAVTNPLVALPGAAHTENAHAAYLPDNFAAFRAPRAAKLFADTRRQLRRLQEGGTVRMELDIPPGAEHDRVMAALAQQKGRRWRDTGNPDAFVALPGFAAFFAQLNTRPLQGIRAVVSALYLDDHPIATHWGLRSNDNERYYWLMPAYDADWAKFSPGRLLMEAVIQQCIAEKVAVFDLTVGDEVYKAQWADVDLDLYALQQARSVLGALVVGAARVKHAAREMPALRAAVQWVRKVARGQR
ncbi:MAG: GNAT family N-acetyltransferase [Pseudomonadota bacterium]